MSATAVGITSASPSAVWHGPGARDRARRGFEWRTLVWSLVFPPKRHRVGLTMPGLFLMMLALGIGTAAYNTASNILFISLSLLLACLLLSGLLSWFNISGVCWRLRPSGQWRAGHDTLVTVEAQNRKTWLPTYGLWFELATHPKRAAREDAADKKMKVRDILAAAEKEVTRGQLFLRERLEAGGEAALDWGVRPAVRGAAVIELSAVGSLFPFGFLKKVIGAGLRHTVLVWPAQVDYQTPGVAAARSGSSGQSTGRAGVGDDLRALRKYAQGDSHRLIHWKASARLGQLMVRQFAAESHDGYVLRVDASALVWTRPEQFELLCSFAGTLAEDYYAAGRLRGVIVNAGPLLETRRLRDLEAFLDLLAGLEFASTVGRVPSSRERTILTGEGTRPANFSVSENNLITFAPEGARGVTAYVDGIKTASA